MTCKYKSEFTTIVYIIFKYKTLEKGKLEIHSMEVFHEVKAAAVRQECSKFTKQKHIVTETLIIGTGEVLRTG